MKFIVAPNAVIAHSHAKSLGLARRDYIPMINPGDAEGARMTNENTVVVCPIGMLIDSELMQQVHENKLKTLR